jgi:succinyl-CoA synthetase beta subunit
MAAILEPDVKALLRDSGLRVPQGHLCASLDAVDAAATELAGAVVVKAVVPAKGKQLAGGIRFASTPQDAHAAAAELLGSGVGGFEVREILVERRETLRAEIYVSVSLDSSAKAYRLTVCADGGAGVEATLARGAGRSMTFRPANVPWAHEVRALMIEGGIRGVALRHCPDAIVRLCRAAVRFDLLLLEINPLALLDDGTAMAVGVLASLDESALERQPKLAARALQHVDQLLRPLTPWEQAFDELNAALPDGGDIRFGEFPDGDIGMMVLGGGAGLVALDAVARAGGRPANFMDMTSAAGRAEEKVYRATRLFLEQRRLRGLLIGSNIGAFLPVPIRMRGVARAVRESNRPGFPVVARLAGLADDEVGPIVEGLPLTSLRDEVTLEEAVDVFMRQLERPR